jgi:hypothetical protein
MVEAYQEGARAALNHDLKSFAERASTPEEVSR